MRLLRRRRRNAGKNPSPTWQDNRPDWMTDDRAGRYMHIPEIDRWRAVPFDMPPDPEPGHGTATGPPVSPNPSKERSTKEPAPPSTGSSKPGPPSGSPPWKPITPTTAP